MKRLRSICCALLLILAGSSVLEAQLVTTGGGPVSANALVSNLIGQGVTFSNATYTGRPVATGTFNGTNSNIGLNSGVIITTGHINVAPGPNNNGGATFSNNGPNIPELETLAQSTTFDGAILEFDFVPQSNFISFNYVFASEEYNEYVCSEFNDAFAFFISGPGIVGAENLAVVPSTSIPVTINTINNGSVGALGSSSNSPCILGNSAYFVGNTQNSVQYDGFTTVLTAQRSVIACQTYHIRLMIADGADDIFDSAVFLEENSFSSATYTMGVSTQFNDSTIYEGCTVAEVTFSRPDADPVPLTINYTVGGSASPGVDYAALPGSITIPAGQTSASVSISAFTDGINEGTETIIINAIMPCGTIPETIYIKEKPAINVIAPNQSICDGSGPVVLSASANGGIQPYSFSWSTGATTSSISVNPSVSTTYTVAVTDFCGTTGTANPMAQIAGVPTASIDVPPYVCSDMPATVRYTGTAPPSAVYIWDFDNPAGVSSGSDQGPYQVSWGTAGSKTISLRVIENGCSSNVVTTQTIVNPTPTATFVVDPVVCAGQITTITYTGTGTDGAGYGWGFPGGVIITGGRRGPFEIRWDSVGVYGVTLTVTENGCTSPGNEVFVNVRPTPTSGFTIESPVCVGEASTVIYTGNASSTGTYNWNFAGGLVQSGSGAGPYEVAWLSPGTKNVFLSVTEAGCTGQITTRPVVVNPVPTGNFSLASPICAGQPTMVTYTGTGSPNADYDWNFNGANLIAGSGAGPYTISWDTPGQYTVTLNVSRHGCSGAPYTQTALVQEIPAAPFTVISPVCVGESSTIGYTGSQGSGAGFTWNFSGGQIISGNGAGPYEIYWNTPGVKQITLSVTSPAGCPSPAVSQQVVVNPIPTSVFTAETPVCQGEPSTITYTGTGNPGAQYNWNFNGGQILSGGGQGPYEIYWNTPGIKTITVQVQENGCLSPPTTQQVNVRPLPSGFFTVVSPVCAFNTTTVMYSGNAAPNAFFNWDVDNGVIVSGSGPGPIQVYWESAGPKNIRLTVQENGCTSIAEVQSVQVNPIPTNQFSVVSPICLGDESTVTYTGNALSNASYNWNFGDAEVRAGSGSGPFRLRWDSPGIKTVRLNLSQFGCPGPEAVQEVIVYPIPTSPFSLNDKVCVGSFATITYTGMATPAGNYSWNFAGGLVQSGSGSGPFEVSWNTPGLKNISLSVVENGCSSAVSTFAVEVIPYPTSDFMAQPLTCQGYSTTVTYTGIAQPSATFNWDFGGGTIISGSGTGPYQVNWTTTGEKHLSLVVSNWECASSPGSVLLHVAPTPVSRAGDDQLICPRDTIRLGNDPVNSYAYQWIPATGLNNPGIANPLLMLENMGNTIAPLSYVLVTTLGNCSAYDTVEISVQPMPQVSWNIPEGQCLQDNRFDFGINGNFTDAATFDWDFGSFANQQHSTLRNPQNVRFSTTGIHVIRLRVGDWGCLSPLYVDSIEIYEMPSANFSGSRLDGCPPLRPLLNNLSGGPGTLSYQWDMGDSHTVSGFIPEHSYTRSGIYPVTLHVTTAQGCRSSYTAHSLVNVFPVPDAGFTVNPSVLTTEHPLANVQDRSSGAVSWRYTTGTGEMLYQRNFTHNYPIPGNYTLTQRVTNEYGCTDSADYQLKVEPLMTFFLPNAFTPNDDGDNDGFRCYGLNIETFRMEIYTRWGELVFESNDIEEAWNGRKFNEGNRPVSQMDVYAVVVYVQDSRYLPPRRIDHRVTLVK